MQQIEFENVFEKLKTGEYKNLILSITPWHANSIEASYIKYANPADKTMVLCMWEGENKLAVNESNYLILNHDNTSFFKCKIAEFKSIGSATGLMIAFIKAMFSRRGENMIRIFSTRRINTVSVINVILKIPNAKVTNIVCDEGLATSFDQFTFDFRSVINYIMEQGIKRKISVLYDVLFTKKRNEIILNHEICDRYKTVFSASKTDDQEIYKEMFAPYILLTFAPIDEEMNYLTDEILDDLFFEFQRISIEKSVKIIIKPHPREKNFEYYQKYDFKIIDTKSSMEALLANAPKLPEVIIGNFSTALVTGKIFWDIKTYGMYSFSRCETKEKKERVDRFISLYGNYIIFPKTLKALIESVESDCS